MNAVEIAKSCGMEKRINTVMQTGFLKIAGIWNGDEGVEIMKKDIHYIYGKKGPQIVKKNIDMIEKAVSAINLIKIDHAKWANFPDTSVVKIRPESDGNETVRNFMDPLTSLEGDDMPVSRFMHGEGLLIPTMTQHYEKRGIAT